MMAQLDILIPENWPADGQQAAGSAEPFAWLLRNPDGRCIRSGEAPLNAMPPAVACRMIVPAARVSLSSVRLPAQNRKKFLQALPYAVEDRIMCDPESVHVAAGEAREDGELPVAIVDRVWLRQVLDKLRDNALVPAHVEVETLLAPCISGAWTLIWRGNGGFLRLGMHDGIALDGGNAEQPPVALELAVASGERQPESIRLYLDGADRPDLAAWSSRLGIPVTDGGEWQWPASATHGIDLLQGAFSTGRGHAEWLPRLRPALVLATLILGLQVVFTLADWATLKFENHRLTASMEHSFRKAFPDARVIVDAPLQMRRNLAELRHSAGMADQNDFLPLLARIAPGLSKGARLHGLDYQHESLKVRLTLPDQAALENLRTELPQAGLTSGNSGPAGLEAELTIGKN